MAMPSSGAQVQTGSRQPPGKHILNPLSSLTARQSSRGSFWRAILDTPKISMLDWRVLITGLILLVTLTTRND